MKKAKIKATVIAEGDCDGFGKKWEYRGYIIEHVGCGEFYIYPEENNHISCGSCLRHAKDIIDYKISKKQFNHAGASSPAQISQQ